jgi:uncharacterized protein
MALDAHPCQLAYDVECDAGWCTRFASVRGWMGHRDIDVVIASRPGHAWELNGAEQPDVAGCIDLDLSFTPATNLFAIRRLALNVGDSADAPAAWLRFPELQLERLPQRYERLTQEEYGYSAISAGYAQTLRVSPAGFVTRYPGLWEMAALE